MVKDYDCPLCKNMMRPNHLCDVCKGIGSLVLEEIKDNLIEWCKKTKYSQGDGYSVRMTNKGKLAVSYSNDYPMQHGGGREYILSDNDLLDAMGVIKI